MQAFVSVVVSLTVVLLDVPLSARRDLKPRAAMRRITAVITLTFATPGPAAFVAAAA